MHEISRYLFGQCQGYALFLLLLGCQQGLGQDAQFQQAVQAIESEIRQQLSSGKGPGLSIALSFEKNTACRSYGWRNFDTKAPVSQETRFKNASTGKVLVALALLVLEEQQKVDLEAGLGDYVNGLHPSLQRITLHQLLSHTAGLKDFVHDFGEGGITKHIVHAQKLNKQAFFTVPGKVFSYSNTGYNLLGAVIESVTKQNFNEAMRSLVFLPLGMQASTYRIEELEEEHLAYGHTPSENAFSVNLRIPDNAEERASGMLLTTAKDLLQVFTWLNSPEDQRLHTSIKQKLQKVLADRSKTGADWSYGYGLFHSTHCQEASLWHTGGMPGYAALFLSVPEKKFAMVILSNGSNLNRWKVIQKAMVSLLGADCSPNVKPDTALVAFAPEEIEAMLGTYTQGIGPTIHLLRDGKTLVFKMGEESFAVKKDPCWKVGYVAKWQHTTCLYLTQRRLRKGGVFALLGQGIPQGSGAVKTAWDTGLGGQLPKRKKFHQ